MGFQFGFRGNSVKFGRLSNLLSFGLSLLSRSDCEEAMRHFSFLFVLFMVVGLNDSRSIVKRNSLVSRFTSNPFFLSHFSSFDDYQDYGNYRPNIVRFWVNTDKYEDSEKEKEEDVSIPSFQLVQTDTDSSKQNNDTSAYKNVKDNFESIVPVFKVLPHFEKTHLFNYHVHNPITEATEKNPEPEVPIFKILPHFEHTYIFRNKAKVQYEETVKSKLGATVAFFKSLPHYDRALYFKDTATRKPVQKTEDRKFAVTYYFKSLPHFESSHVFKEPTLFVSKPIKNDDSEEENGVVFKVLPHFNKPQFRSNEGKQRRVVIRKKKVVRKPKKLLQETTFDNVEFGRRLQPRTNASE